MRYELQKYSSHEKNIYCKLDSSLGVERDLKKSETNEMQCGLIRQT